MQNGIIKDADVIEYYVPGRVFRKVHMIDGRMFHSLLMEMFTDKGVGTEIVAGGHD